MNETNPLAEKLRNAIFERDLKGIKGILLDVESGKAKPSSPYEKQSIEECINSIMAMLRSGTKGWNRSGGVGKEDVLDACSRAIARMNGGESQPKGGQSRRKRITGPLKRIPSGERNFPSGEFNAVRIKRR